MVTRMKKIPDVGDLIKRGKVSLDTVLDSLEKTISGLRNQAEQLKEEFKKRREEIAEVRRDNAEIRRQIDSLEKLQWPPNPNLPGDDTLHKKALPAPTHLPPVLLQ
jgi:hypothetical protein